MCRKVWYVGTAIWIMDGRQSQITITVNGK